MKAMILAAGVGSRLHPLTKTLPKPLVPIVNRPVMEHIVALLRKHGFTDIIVNLHYLGDQIQEYFGDGSRFGVKIQYSVEDQLWGDAGSVKRCEDFFENETFLVIGGDDLTDLDLTRFLENHRQKRALASIALSLVDDPAEYGIVLTTDDDRITRFVEKPRGAVFISNTANTGVYIFEPEALELIPRGVPYLFGKTFFPMMLEQKRPIYGYLTANYWMDVGNLAMYQKAHLDAMSDRVALEVGAPERRKFQWIADSAIIEPGADIRYPVVIGEDCHVHAGATVHENTVLGPRCIIQPGAIVRESILWADAHVQEDTRLSGCVVGRGCRVKSNAAIFDGVIVDLSSATDNGL
ncbi:MAG: NDP-sugar synthase [Chthonomonadales bacterium]|nr:NDP-sugar synthase [Chthonomonadales bacterium]